MIKKYLLLFSTVSIGLAGCAQVENAPAEEAVETPPMEETGENAVEEETPEELFEQVQNNAPTQERLDALVDIAMHYYWHGGDLNVAEEEFFQGITLHGDYDIVEESFRQATIIDPLDTDLKRSLAAAQILQNDLPEALNTLEEIQNIDEENFEATLLHAVYSRVSGDDEAFEEGFNRLAEMDEERADDYQALMDSIEEIKDTEFNTEAPDTLPEENHTFITLGYALSDEGEMEETLIERLNVTLEAAEAYPNSHLIVTGGVPKAGNTEAELMVEWLIDNGIDEERISRDPLATDTVENALFSMDIVQNEGFEDITLITSASHMRRALVTFNEANRLLLEMADEATQREFTNIVYMDYDSEEEAYEITTEEDMSTHRDALRTSGIWQFPGRQR
ncbi:ElyC/SanA/YdcF family protein [Alkalibacterium indicireducens]|uniref:ElyC/SanA/YdcF family protein n=1 Tax=Alkalibacterium indicireducens TaxID=398758 RepID=A0ABN1AHX9_9LACT